MPKNTLFLLKNRKNRRALGAPLPDSLASGGWGLCPQTPSLRRLEAQSPDPRNKPLPPPLTMNVRIERLCTKKENKFSLIS